MLGFRWPCLGKICWYVDAAVSVSVTVSAGCHCSVDLFPVIARFAGPVSPCRHVWDCVYRVVMFGNAAFDGMGCVARSACGRVPFHR